MPLFFVYFYILWYIHSFHHIHTIRNPIANRRGSSLSPHRWSAQWWEKSLPGVPSRESNSLGPALQKADALPSEQHRTLSEQHRPYVTVPSNIIFPRNSIQISFRSEPRNGLFRDTWISAKEALFPPRNNVIRSEPIHKNFFGKKFRWQPYNQPAFLPIFQASYLPLCLPASCQRFPVLPLKVNNFLLRII